jgi:site-specific DNA-methyltransferase (adenine-specific)
MACAVEDAGFEIRDMIQWLYGSGFPKSHDVSKGIDKTAGVERVKILVPTKAGNAVRRGEGEQGVAYGDGHGGFTDISEPATLATQEWEGWGTALKPANEPIVLARKPLSEKTVAANVLKWGTGAINIDGCRVGDFDHDAYVASLIDEASRKGEASANKTYQDNGSTNFAAKPGPRGGSPKGRFPANVITDGSDEVVAAFPYKKSGYSDGTKNGVQKNVFGKFGAGTFAPTYGDEGSAARFFYQAKANSKDRANSKHPTVKPIALMRYLARLITPPGGTILDPFAGSGTTGEAAYLEGFNCYLIEREAEYVADISARFAALAAPAANDNEQQRVAA